MKKSKSTLLICQVIIVSFWIRYLLSFKKLPRVLELIESKKREVQMEKEAMQHLISILMMISRWKFFVIRNNCLKKNLLIYYFLLRFGMKDLQIFIGVRKLDLNLDGHCWLTKRGHVFLEPEESVEKYNIIYSSGV